jgi:hypothetical protein
MHPVRAIDMRRWPGSTGRRSTRGDGQPPRLGSARAGHRRQRGVVLVLALVLLVALTLIGVSAMNTTQQQERMAANVQEGTRAFQAAETGLSQAFNAPGAWDLSGTWTDTEASYAGTTDTAVKRSLFVGWSPPPPGSLYSATSFQAAHFDFQSIGTTTGGRAVTVHGGAYQIAPLPN